MEGFAVHHAHCGHGMGKVTHDNASTAAIPESF
jgi:hypothetical protein